MVDDQQNLNEKEIKIKDIYQKAKNELSRLRSRQKDIIKKYKKDLENKKINDIRKKIGS